jgi:hypothetical protein
MSNLTITSLTAIVLALTVTALTFIATLGAQQAGRSTPATVNPTEMMELAPRNLPTERFEAS